jgi:hypothetical protein
VTGNDGGIVFSSGSLDKNAGGIGAVQRGIEGESTTITANDD